MHFRPNNVRTDRISTNGLVDATPRFASGWDNGGRKGINQPGMTSSWVALRRL